MSSRRAWFPQYAAQWLSDPWVRSLTPEQRAIFWDLINHGWENDGIDAVLIKDGRYFSRLCNTSVRRFHSIWSSIRTKFALETINGREIYRNHRQEEERSVAHSFSLTQSDKAHKRWKQQRHEHATALPQAVPEKTLGNAYTNQPTNHTNQPTASGNAEWGKGGFEEVWISLTSKRPGDLWKLQDIAHRCGGKKRARLLIAAFLRFVEALGRAQMGQPAISVAGFEKHFERCEDIVDGRFSLDSVKPKNGTAAQPARPPPPEWKEKEVHDAAPPPPEFLEEYGKK